ncbi:MAG: class F sortase [Chloroflexi bacterium]|nr:class F sortase [Chloroflexota bacterium]
MATAAAAGRASNSPPAATSSAASPSASAPGSAPSPAASTTSSSPAPVTATSNGQAIGAGSRLQIPSIGVDAPLITLGVDRDGVMQVPDNGRDVAWYNFSAPPGSAGNAVLAGHVDTATSTTAVFSRLKDLKPGDKLDIAGAGKQIDYEVFWSKQWPDATAPLALILGNAPSATLTLITCAGTWDRSAQNYSDRLVVRAKLPGSI